MTATGGPPHAFGIQRHQIAVQVVRAHLVNGRQLQSFREVPVQMLEVEA